VISHGDEHQSAQVQEINVLGMSNLVKPPKIAAEASWGFVWQQPPSSSFQGGRSV